MSNLLIQSCSASKNEVNRPTPALDVYSGYFYKIIKKSIREDEFRPDTDIAILSAKYGLLDQADTIEFYDRRMDSTRATQLNDSVVDAATDKIQQGKYDQVVLNMGTQYEDALQGLDDHVDSPIAKIPGGGIGEKGHALHRFIRGDDSVIMQVDEI